MSKLAVTYLILAVAIGVFFYKSTEVINAGTMDTVKHAMYALQQASIDTMIDNSTTMQLNEQEVIDQEVEAGQFNETQSNSEFFPTRESTGRATDGTEIKNSSFNVVIAMKIHDEAFMPEVKQSLCLLDVAYNSRFNYDIVIFHTIPINESHILEVQQIVSPANVTFVLDDMTFEEQIANMTLEQQETLVNRCNEVNTTADLSWRTRCRDDRFVMPIAYCWMSEFRSKQIWVQEVLRPYKYMLWWDSDSFATMVWKQDPIEYMIQNDLVLLMGNYAQGITRGNTGVQQKLLKVYNKTLCSAELVANGVLNATYGTAEECGRNHVKQVHGFFHITNLDFYRLPQNLYWYDVQIGDNKFSRVWDDQLAVMVPAVMLAPERTAEMERVGIDLDVFHNGFLMGKRKWRGGGYLAFWRTEGQTKFPEAREKCSPYIKTPMR